MKTTLLKTIMLGCLGLTCHLSMGQIGNLENKVQKGQTSAIIVETPDRKASCIDCDIYGEQVLASLHPVLDKCGYFNISAPPSGIACYSVILKLPAPYSDIYIVPGTLETFYLGENGSHLATLEIQPGGALYCYRKDFKIDVDCFDPPLPKCEILGDDIYNSITETSCGNYEITVPNGSAAVYTMQFRKTGLGIPQLLHDGVNTFSYSGNGTYSSTLKLFPIQSDRPVLPCYSDKQRIVVSCFSIGSIATPNPFTDTITLMLGKGLVIQEVILTNLNGIEVGRSKTNQIQTVKTPSGMYFARVTYTNGSSETIQVIKK